MAAKKKVVPVVAAVTLGMIVAATLDASQGFLFTLPAVHIPLIEAGMVEINPELTNEAGEYATRATEKGINEVNPKTNETQHAQDVSINVKGFALESGVPMPTIKRGRHGVEAYPFGSMEVGQSFFVPATEAKPNPAKSLASTVSSATARYAVQGEGVKKNRKGEDVPVMIETRKFVVRSVEENGIAGARIWRSA